MYVTTIVFWRLSPTSLPAATVRPTHRLSEEPSPMKKCYVPPQLPSLHTSHNSVTYYFMGNNQTKSPPLLINLNSRLFLKVNSGWTMTITIKPVETRKSITLRDRGDFIRPWGRGLEGASGCNTFNFWYRHGKITQTRFQAILNPHNVRYQKL